ncbi:hypothetical protein FHS15_004343 [Paenibacillus castaneae]|uniref:hypothetical protein n=1 Tax=Paenibacillus castaneae TaxID=474957 RepID=UPI0011AF7FBF|nr:hypothetical protein [Paenibacillus castaneae]NIK79185.1 hypothetical protein [Paenibacillus castaneae]
MRKMTFKAAIPVVCVVFLISACSTAQSDRSMQTKSVQRSAAHKSHSHINKISVIPSYNGPKHETTNQYGSTYSGMGMSVYSRIGSSGLSADGESGNMEAVLNVQGIHGVKVLMLGDTVVVGAEKGGASGIDPLQSKLLSPYSGKSGVSNKNTSGSTSVRTEKEKDLYLNQAKQRVQKLLGGQVRVLTVTHPDALAAMERHKRKGNVTMTSANRAQSEDIALILKHAEGSK